MNPEVIDLVSARSSVGLTSDFVRSGHRRGGMGRARGAPGALLSLASSDEGLVPPSSQMLTGPGIATSIVLTDYPRATQRPIATR